MTTLVSRAEFARQHGASKQAATKWEARGALVIVDGKVNVEASDKKMMFAGLGRFADKPPAKPQPSGGRPATKPAAAPVVAPDPETAEAIAELAADVSEEFAHLPGLQRFVAVIAAGGYSSAADAETVKQNALALKHLLDARVKANELCDIADAETVLFEQSRQARDAWISFPDRIGPVLAGELGVEPEKLVEALTAHVHQQLADMGEPENPFREAGQASDGFASRLDAAAEVERPGLGGRLPEAREAGGE